MAKFSAPQRPAYVSSPIATTPERVLTHEGGVGWARDAKSELFLFAISNMVSEPDFYESATERDARFSSLIAQVVAEDPAWVARFVPYLRNTMQMRSASVVMACEYVRAGGTHGRAVIDSACSRPDEPAEVLAYWASRYGRRFPQPVKRGVADAVRRLYNERSVMRYNGGARAWKMGDVVELVHPKPTDETQTELFRYLLDDRHHGDATERLSKYGRPEGISMLPTLTFAAQMDALPTEDRREWLRAHPTALGDAGMSWERLSSWLPGGMDAEAWEAIIPTMGSMALVRNLRNFDQAGISDETAAIVSAKISDPEEVRKSRQFPLRYLSAWKAVQSMRWGPALETALEHSVSNVPSLKGRTLILIDVSGSMFCSVSGRSEAQRWEVAGIFGFALARQAESADVVAYDTGTYPLPPQRGSILRSMDQLRNYGGGGTYTMEAIKRHYAAHDRVIVLTDEQSHDAGAALPAIPKTFTFNVAGHRTAHLPSGENGRFSFGGLTDAGFRAIALLESGKDDAWPF